MHDTIRQIRQRIVWIILRTFIMVVVVTLLSIIAVTGVTISNSLDFSPLNRLPITALLEGYYIGRGGWDGVQTLITPEAFGDQLTLLDVNKRILIDHGKLSTPNIGVPYQIAPHDIFLNLKAGGDLIGFLVFDRASMPSQFVAITTILAPVSLVSVFLALLATVMVATLSRRIVTPLAEVIAAARAVAEGKLETRVQVQGATQDLRILTDSFNQMANALERNDRERRALLADIAHELRTPIAGLRGRLEGILDGVYPADQKHISLALKSSYLLERLVEDLRILTFAESGQLNFIKKPTDLKLLANHAVEMFYAEAQERSIDLTVDSAVGDFVVLIDPQRTEQVIGNLVSNALRYIPQNGRIWLSLDKKQDRISLSVSDNGKGVAQEELPLLFNRFWRKDKSRARASGGSGLGLAIAKQLIEAQGGTIRAENLPARGLKITMEFSALDM